jgi:hypothetical protein
VRGVHACAACAACMRARACARVHACVRVRGGGGALRTHARCALITCAVCPGDFVLFETLKLPTLYVCPVEHVLGRVPMIHLRACVHAGARGWGGGGDVRSAQRADHVCCLSR